MRDKRKRFNLENRFCLFFECSTPSFRQLSFRFGRDSPPRARRVRHSNTVCFYEIFRQVHTSAFTKLPQNYFRRHRTSSVTFPLTVSNY